MKDQTNNNSRYGRRISGRLAAVITAALVITFGFACSRNTPATVTDGTGDAVNASKPDSRFGGVQIGTITYSWRTLEGGLENIVRYCREANISSIELMSGDLEAWLGIPPNPLEAVFSDVSRDPATLANGQINFDDYQFIAAGSGYIMVPRQLTPEQQAAVDQYDNDVKNWRIHISMEKVEEARRLLADNGIHVHIVKFSPAGWSDEEIDYAFKVAKAMGAQAITEEISLEAAERLAPFAEKHDMYIAFHNHMQYAEEGFSADPILAVSPSVMLNFDAGHFYGSTGIHPNEMIKKYHNRIYSIHIKDKTGPTTTEPNENQVWGQGETPLEDILLLIKQEKWPIYCDIEL